VGSHENAFIKPHQAMNKQVKFWVLAPIVPNFTENQYTFAAKSDSVAKINQKREIKPPTSTLFSRFKPSRADNESPYGQSPPDTDQNYPSLQDSSTCVMIDKGP